MEEVLDKLQSLNLDINSETAYQIADMYLTYKYFDSILGFIFLTTLIVVSYKLIKKGMDS